MQPKRQDRGAFELFQAHFDQLLNPKHEFFQLACKIDWPHFDLVLADCISPDMGTDGTL